MEGKGGRQGPQGLSSRLVPLPSLLWEKFIFAPFPPASGPKPQAFKAVLACILPPCCPPPYFWSDALQNQHCWCVLCNTVVSLSSKNQEMSAWQVILYVKNNLPEARGNIPVVPSQQHISVFLMTTLPSDALEEEHDHTREVIMPLSLLGPGTNTVKFNSAHAQALVSVCLCVCTRAPSFAAFLILLKLDWGKCLVSQLQTEEE